MKDEAEINLRMVQLDALKPEERDIKVTRLITSLNTIDRIINFPAGLKEIEDQIEKAKLHAQAAAAMQEGGSL